MQLSYFPGPTFGWVFFSLLMSILVVASYTDVRALKIPKWITITALALGVGINIVRGIWLGAIGREAYLLGENGALISGLDGLLFSLFGFLLGFGLFFGLWFLSICGGGDVKLFAALGTWTGPNLLLWIFPVTVVFVAILLLGRIVWAFLAGKKLNFRKQFKEAQKRRQQGKPIHAKSRALGFALPLAMSCLLVLPWAFRFDLHLARLPEQGHTNLSK